MSQDNQLNQHCNNSPLVLCYRRERISKVPLYPSMTYLLAPKFYVIHAKVIDLPCRHGYCKLYVCSTRDCQRNHGSDDFPIPIVNDRCDKVFVFATVSEVKLRSKWCAGPVQKAHSVFFQNILEVPSHTDFDAILIVLQPIE